MRDLRHPCIPMLVHDLRCHGDAKLLTELPLAQPVWHGVIGKQGWRDPGLENQEAAQIDTSEDGAWLGPKDLSYKHIVVCES